MVRSVLGIALTCYVVLAISNPARARAGNDDLSFVTTVAHMADTPTIDIRSLEKCTQASIPGARCLPVSNFMTPSGAVIGFHALRWLLGTVGLNGGETVLIVGANSQDVKIVGILLHKAGQSRVRMLEGPFNPAARAPAGEARSMSREVIFTAAMRIDTDF